MGRIRRNAACATLALASLLPGPGFAETSAAPQLAQEEVFLDVLPKFQIPDDVQPILGAVNEEFRNCRHSWPRGYWAVRSGPEAGALRDIYSFVRAMNVIETKNCSCSGKVASWQDVEVVAATLRQRFGVSLLNWRHTRETSAAARRLIGVAETLCGGRF